MGLGTSLFLVAVGAILRFAVTTTAKGLDIHTVGLILMIVGILGLVISLFWMVTWTDRRRGTGAVVDPRDRPAMRDPDAY